MSKRLLIGLVGIAAMLSMASADMLLNPGFATQGSGGAQDAANWEQAEASREDWGSHDGDGYLMALPSWTLATAGEFYQDAPATAGMTYELDFWQEGDGGWDGTALSASLVWLNNSGGTISSTDMDLMPFSLTPSWTNHVFQGIAPVNTATVRVLFAATTLSEGAGAGKFDEMSLTAVVPEPGTLVCLSLGLVGLFFWRRRNH